MKHYGDITKLNGAELPVVDCITGGSPCQDLSVAGKRAGLEGERSGLFMEQIRIVKEMREHDRASGRSAFLVRPRYMVWENVPGALSSNQGKDFQAVLTEIVRIVQPHAADVPLPSKGRWAKAGTLVGYGEDGSPFSVSWRIHDAQFWGTTMWDDAGNPLWLGTPQRRKRIAVVADFGGLSAPEILFERKGLRRNPEPSEQEREETAGAVGTGSDEPMPFKTVAIEGNGTRESHHGGGYAVADTMFTLNSTEQHAVAAKTYRKQAHPMNAEMAQGYEETSVSDTLNIFDNTEARTPTLILNDRNESDCAGTSSERFSDKDSG